MCLYLLCSNDDYLSYIVIYNNVIYTMLYIYNVIYIVIYIIYIIYILYILLYICYICICIYM